MSAILVGLSQDDGNSLVALPPAFAHNMYVYVCMYVCVCVCIYVCSYISSCACLSSHFTLLPPMSSVSHSSYEKQASASSIFHPRITSSRRKVSAYMTLKLSFSFQTLQKKLKGHKCAVPPALLVRPRQPRHPDVGTHV